MKLSIYEYTPEHRQNCVDIFDSNTPQFFAREERPKYIKFLESLKPPYYYVVGDPDNGILACGGIKIELENQMGKLRWDMVSSGFRGKGIGSFLTRSRIAFISQYPDINWIQLGTSQY